MSGPVPSAFKSGKVQTGEVQTGEALYGEFVDTGFVDSDFVKKADVLVEALPWLKRFHGRTVVIKCGGSALEDATRLQQFGEDITFMRYCGIRSVVTHGGGPQISNVLERLGIDTHFTAGLRVTTPEVMEVVRMVLIGQVQREIVKTINSHGAFSVGLCGEDANMFTAVRHPAMLSGDPIDIGLVGDIVDVDPGPVLSVLRDGRIPVVSSVARGEDGQTYNVNADTAAAALAVALGAEKLLIVTDVDGLHARWPPQGPPISSLTATRLKTLIPELEGGMVPKMQACLRALEGGVHSAHILDGRRPHALMLEMFTDAGIGTMVTNL